MWNEIIVMWCMCDVMCHIELRIVVKSFLAFLLLKWRQRRVVGNQIFLSHLDRRGKIQFHSYTYIYYIV